MLVNTNVKQANVALYFNTKYSDLNIDRTAVNKIWKNCEKWLAILPNLQTAHTFCQHPVRFPELDKALQL